MNRLVSSGDQRICNRGITNQYFFDTHRTINTKIYRIKHIHTSIQVLEKVYSLLEYKDATYTMQGTRTNSWGPRSWASFATIFHFAVGGWSQPWNLAESTCASPSWSEKWETFSSSSPSSASQPNQKVKLITIQKCICTYISIHTTWSYKFSNSSESSPLER